MTVNYKTKLNRHPPKDNIKRYLVVSSISFECFEDLTPNHITSKPFTNLSLSLFDKKKPSNLSLLTVYEIEYNISNKHENILYK